MLYCYFIARSEPEIEKLPYRTLHAAPLHFVHREELVAAVRALPAGTRSSPQLMLEHSAVLATALKRTTVLPLRFGTSFRSESGVVQLLAARAPEILAALERLDGKAEMGLRISLAEGASAQRHAAEISEACRPLDSWMEVRTDAAGGKVLELAHLIRLSDLESYRKSVKPYAAEMTGPRPPFHFLPQFLRWPVRAERRSGRGARASSQGGA